MASLGTEMPAAIKRARAVRDTFIELRGTPGIMVEPQIAMMTTEIDEATDALASGDIVRMLRAYEAIKDYEH